MALTDYNKKYYSHFYGFRDSSHYEIEIYEKDYSGGVEYIEYGGGENPIEDNIRGSREDVSQNIIGREMEFTFYPPPDNYEAYNNFLDSQYKDHYLLFKKDTNEIFRGWVQPDLIEKNFINSPNSITISAVDGLSDLKNHNFTDSTDESYFVEDNQSLLYTLAVALEKIGFNLDFEISVNTFEINLMDYDSSTQHPNECAFKRCTIDLKRFFKLKKIDLESSKIYVPGMQEAFEATGVEITTDFPTTFVPTNWKWSSQSNEIDNCFDVIQKILRPFNAILYQYGGKYIITNSNELDSQTFYFFNDVEESSKDFPEYSSSPQDRTNVVSVDDEKFIPFGDQSKIPPKKSQYVDYIRKKLGERITGVDSWDQNPSDPEWECSSSSLVVDSSDSVFHGKFDASGQYLYLISDWFEVTTPSDYDAQSENKMYLKFRFQYGGVVINGGDHGASISMRIELEKADGTTVGTSGHFFSHERYKYWESPNDEKFVITQEGFYQLRIRISTTWILGGITSVEFKLKGRPDVRVDDSKIETSANDTEIKREQDSPGLEGNKLTLYFGDAAFDDEVNALKIDGNLTADWNRWGADDEIPLNWIFCIQQLNNFRDFVDIVTVSRIDDNNDIRPDTILKIIPRASDTQRYYRIVGWRKNWYTSEIKLRLIQIYPYQAFGDTGNPITEYTLDTLDGIQRELVFPSLKALNSEYVDDKLASVVKSEASTGAANRSYTGQNVDNWNDYPDLSGTDKRVGIRIDKANDRIIIGFLQADDTTNHVSYAAELEIFGAEATTVYTIDKTGIWIGSGDTISLDSSADLATISGEVVTGNNNDCYTIDYMPNTTSNEVQFRFRITTYDNSNINTWNVSCGDRLFGENLTIPVEFWFTPKDTEEIDALRTKNVSQITEEYMNKVVYYGTSYPTNPKEGWLCVRTDKNPVTLERYDGSDWNVSATLGSNWSDIVDDNGNMPSDNATENRTVAQSTAPDPVNYHEGDVWIDADTGTPYVHDGSGWKRTVWADISSDSNAPIDNATRNDLIRQSNEPNASNYSEGDIWVDSDNGNPYIHDGNDWQRTTWETIKNDANAPSDNADVTANNLQNGIYRQDTEPTNPQEGWVWLDTTDNSLYRYTSGSWERIGPYGKYMDSSFRPIELRDNTNARDVDSEDIHDHSYHTLDNVSDGTTYKRPTATTLDGNDVHLGNAKGNLDNVPDGTHFARARLENINVGGNNEIKYNSGNKIDDLEPNEAGADNTNNQISAQSIGNLSDISLPNTKAAGQLLIWNATNGQFENATLSNSGNVTIANTDASVALSVPNDLTVIGNYSVTGLSDVSSAGGGKILPTTEYDNLTDANAQLAALHTDGIPTFNAINTNQITEKTTNNGISIEGITLKDNNVTIPGNLTVNGTEFITNTETVKIEDNLAIINNGETGDGISAGFAGWEADRGTLTNYKWGFDESSDLWKLGKIGNLQAVATREDSPVDTALAFWNAANNKFETSSSLIWSGSDLSVNGNAVAAHITSTSNPHQSTLQNVTDQGNSTSNNITAASGSKFGDITLTKHGGSYNSIDCIYDGYFFSSGIGHGVAENMYVYYDGSDAQYYKPTNNESLWTEVNNSASNFSINYSSSTTSGDIIDKVTLFNVNNSGTGTFSGVLQVDGTGASYFKSDVEVRNSKSIGTDNWVSETTGWNIDYNGHLDTRYIFTDELRAKIFTADVEQALAGSDILAKSVTHVAQNFTLPANTNSTTIIVEDLPGAEGTLVFSANDYVKIKYYNRNGGLTLLDIWGQVTNGDNTGGGTEEQSWTWTTIDDGGINGTTINADSVIVDYGVSGDGYIERTTLGDYAPYTQIAVMKASPDQSDWYDVKMRYGNLSGISLTNTSNPGYGLVSLEDNNNYTAIRWNSSSDYGVKGVSGGSTIFQLGSTNEIAGWTFTNTLFKNGTDIQLDAGNKRIALNNNAMAFGYAVGGTGNHGIQIDSDNYWYSSKAFKAYVDASNYIELAGGLDIHASIFNLQAGNDYWRTSDNHFQLGGSNGLSYDGTTITAGSNVNVDGADIKVNSLPDFPSNANLVGYWSFDGGDVTDNSQNSNDGTVNGATINAKGISGRTFLFDGIDDYIDIPVTLNSTKFTVSIWLMSTIDPVNQTNYAKVIAGYNSSNIRTTPYIQIHSNSEILGGFIDNTGSRHELSSSIIPDISIWYYITLMYNGSTLFIFVNGVEKNSISVSATPYSTDYVYLGKNPKDIEKFEGKIDEPRIYNTTLTKNQIKSLYLYPGGPNKTVISGNQIRTGSIVSTSGNLEFDLINEKLTATNDFVLDAGSGDLRLDASTPMMQVKNGYITALNSAGNSGAGLVGADYAADDILIWAGDTVANKDSAPFRVDENGAMVASNANITGTISASTGDIGGWNISSSYLGKSFTNGALRLSTNSTDVSNANYLGTPNGLPVITMFHSYDDGPGNRAFIHMGETYSGGWTNRLGFSFGPSKSDPAYFEISRNVSDGTTVAQIAGWNIDANKLYKNNVELNSSTPSITVGDSNGQRVLLDGADNTFKFYNSNGSVLTIDDNVFVNGAGIKFFGSSYNTVISNGGLFFEAGASSYKSAYTDFSIKMYPSSAVVSTYNILNLAKYKVFNHGNENYTEWKLEGITDSTDKRFMFGLPTDNILNELADGQLYIEYSNNTTNPKLCVKKPSSGW